MKETTEKKMTVSEGIELLSDMPDAEIFNGTFTIENTETTEHRTFQIKTQKPDAKFAPGSRIVSLLDGPDNWSNYRGFAFVRDDGKGIAVWRSKRHENPEKSSAFEVYADMLSHFFGLSSDRDWTEMGYEMTKSLKCSVCNRKLTHPESLRTGIGPICAGR